LIGIDLPNVPYESQPKNEETMNIWKQIEALSHQKETPDAELTHFIEPSGTYGSLKSEPAQYGWAIVLPGSPVCDKITFHLPTFVIQMVPAFVKDNTCIQ